MNLVDNIDLNDNKIYEISEKTKNIVEKILSNEKKVNFNIKSNNGYKNKDNNKINNNELDNILRKYNSILIKAKEKMPNISQNTKDIIQKLKILKNNKRDDIEKINDDHINNTNLPLYSLRFKYEDLLKEVQFLIPIKYKIIIKSFSSLEQEISLSKIRKNKNGSNSFDIIRNITNHKFDLKILKQILYIVPHFYILTYVDKKENNIPYNLNNALYKDYDLNILYIQNIL